MTGVARRETQERTHSATLKQHFFLFFFFAVVFSIIVNRTEEEKEIPRRDLRGDRRNALQSGGPFHPRAEAGRLK
jgi:hypothetical protein